MLALEVCTRFICFICFFIGLLSPVRALYGALFRHKVERVIHFEYLSIRVKLVDTTHFIISTYNCNESKPNTVSLTVCCLVGRHQKQVIHALQIQFWSCTAPLVDKTDTLLADLPFNRDLSVHRFTCSWKCPRFCLLDGQFVR